MVEDYNNVDKFKSEIVDTLNKYENIWASNCPDYKPFISYPHGSSVNDELDSSLNNLIIEDKRQIEDQYPFLLVVLVVQCIVFSISYQLQFKIQ